MQRVGVGPAIMITSKCTPCKSITRVLPAGFTKTDATRIVNQARGIEAQRKKCKYCPPRVLQCTCKSSSSFTRTAPGTQLCKCLEALNSPCCDCCSADFEVTKTLNNTGTNPLSNNAMTQAITESVGLNKYNQNYVDLRHNTDLSDAEPNSGTALFNVGKDNIKEPIKKLWHIENNVTQVVVNDVFLTHNSTTNPGKIRIYNTMMSNPSTLMYGKIPILFMLSQPAQNYAKSLKNGPETFYKNDAVFKLYEKTGRIYHKRLSSNYAEKQSYIANISVEWLGIINSLPLSRISYTEHTYKMSDGAAYSRQYSNTSKNNDNHALYARSNVKARSAYYTGNDEEIFSAFVALQ